MLSRSVLGLAILVAVLQICLAENKVLLISMDGFRWDYIDNTDTPNFDKFISEGTRVTKVKNVFSTITFPNHWTMVTGKYEEDHGIVANRMFDSMYGEQFSYGRETKWFNESEPIWITAVREGKKSGSYMWVGNQAKYEGAELTKVQPYAGGVDHQMGLDYVVDWLATDELDFAAFYMNEPDHTGHEHGPNSPEVLEKVRELDVMLGNLMERIKKRNLDGKLNIVIAADHGMASVSANRTINIKEIVDFKADVQWYYISIIGHIMPRPGSEQRVYRLLKNASEAEDSHFKVYYKQDVPAEFHYSRHRRIQPIVLIAENGWAMTTSNRKFTLKGQHGFNNSWADMQSMMVARGPNIVQNYTQSNMNIINLYPMLCELLNLTTCYKNSDATPAEFADIVKLADIVKPSPSPSPNPIPSPSSSPSPSSASMMSFSVVLVFSLSIVHMLA